MVFNAAQCDNLPEELYRVECPTVNPNAAESNARAEKMLALAAISYGGNRAFYSPSSDSITLPVKESFFSNEGFYMVALHELSHWTAHPSRLDRVLVGQKKNKESYATEELIAQTASFFLMSELGFDVTGADNIEQHTAHYLKSWLMALKGDMGSFFGVVSKAQRAADYLIQAAEGLQQAG